MRRKGAAGLGLTALIATLAAWAPAASNAQGFEAGSPFNARGNQGPSGQFETEARSGWKARVGSSGSQVYVSFQKKKVQATYAVSGATSESELQATFSDFGVVDMRFKPKGKKEKQKLPRNCEGKPDKVQKGTWKGTFTFSTNFTSVDIGKAKGKVIYPGDFICKLEPSPSPKAALLTSGGSASFSAFRLKGNDPETAFSAFRTSSIDGVLLYEAAFANGRKSLFEYDFAQDTATVSPPSPFSGTGDYAQGSWTGNLSVDFATGPVDLISGSSASLVEPE